MRSVTAIRKKYGKNAFQKWGRTGTSPVLKAWKEGRVTIHTKPQKKKRKKLE